MATETQLPDQQEPFEPLRTSPAVPPAPKETTDGISLLNMLVVLTGRPRTILVITLASLVISLLVAFLLPNEYTATVLLLPPRENSSLASILESQLGDLGPLAALGGQSLGLRNPNDMYVAMLKSEVIEDAMVRQFNLMKEYRERYFYKARRKFEKHVDINGSGKDGLVHISVEDRSPQRAAEMANSYVDHFRLLSQRLAASKAGQRADFFHQQLEQVRVQLANAEDAMEQTEESTGLIQLSSQALALIESAANLRAEIAAKKVQIQALRTFATGKNAQLQRAEQELASLQAQLDKLGGSQQSPNSLIVPKGRVPQAGLEYARKLRDVKYYETIMELLARQYELARLEQAKEGALVQVVSPAFVPDHRSFPPRLLIVIGGTLGGMFIAMLTALSLAGWERLREDPESNAKLDLIREQLHRWRSTRR